MIKSFWSKKFWGIKIGEYTAVILFYTVCAITYRLTIWITSKRSMEALEWKELFDFEEFMRIAGLDYILKLLITIPIWWLIFKRLQHFKLQYRLLFHLIGLPVFIAVFKFTYYEISAYLDWARLGGSGQVWDIYIPSLFYLIQFGIFHAYEYYHTNQRNLELKNQLREIALTSELSAIKAQLNPHFLYNVFNTISASVPAEQETTRELIATLADLFRYQLKASKRDLVELKEEIEFIENYLQLEKARFEERLQIDLDIPEAILSEYVPPLLIQPLVENAIKHGIAPKIEGGKINLKIEKRNDQLHFMVADTGVGVPDKSVLFGTEGVGLNNTKIRLEKKYQCQMSFSDNQPSGLIIRFTLPVFQKPLKVGTMQNKASILSSSELMM